MNTNSDLGLVIIPVNRSLSKLSSKILDPVFFLKICINLDYIIKYHFRCFCAVLSCIGSLKVILVEITCVSFRLG